MKKFILVMVCVVILFAGVAYAILSKSFKENDSSNEITKSLTSIVSNIDTLNTEYINEHNIKASSSEKVGANTVSDNKKQSINAMCTLDEYFELLNSKDYDAAFKMLDSTYINELSITTKTLEIEYPNPISYNVKSYDTVQDYITVDTTIFDQVLDVDNAEEISNEKENRTFKIVTSNNEFKIIEGGCINSDNEQAIINNILKKTRGNDYSNLFVLLDKAFLACNGISNINTLKDYLITTKFNNIASCFVQDISNVDDKTLISCSTMENGIRNKRMFVLSNGLLSLNGYFEMFDSEDTLFSNGYVTLKFHGVKFTNDWISTDIEVMNISNDSIDLSKLFDNAYFKNQRNTYYTLKLENTIINVIPAGYKTRIELKAKCYKDLPTQFVYSINNKQVCLDLYQKPN